jgi:regulator of replication initiation timing
MSDGVLNEEIARLEIEIDAVRDALDEAIKRNEALEEENKCLKEEWPEDSRDQIESLKTLAENQHVEIAMLRGQRDVAIEDFNDALAALTEARDDLDANGSIPDSERERLRDRLTLALASLEAKL